MSIYTCVLTRDDESDSASDLVVHYSVKQDGDDVVINIHEVKDENGSAIDFENWSDERKDEIAEACLWDYEEDDDEADWTD